MGKRSLRRKIRRQGLPENELARRDLEQQLEEAGYVPPVKGQSIRDAAADIGLVYLVGRLVKKLPPVQIVWVGPAQQLDPLSEELDKRSIGWTVAYMAADFYDMIQSKLTGKGQLLDAHGRKMPLTERKPLIVRGRPVVRTREIPAGSALVAREIVSIRQGERDEKSDE